MGGGRLETDLWGEGKAVLELSQRTISEKGTPEESPAQEQERQLHVDS